MIIRTDQVQCSHSLGRRLHLKGRDEPATAVSIWFSNVTRGNGKISVEKAIFKIRQDESYTNVLHSPRLEGKVILQSVS